MFFNALMVLSHFVGSKPFLNGTLNQYTTPQLIQVCYQAHTGKRYKVLLLYYR